MRLIRIFLIILFFILVLNPVLLVAANEDEVITVEAEHVHVHYIDNAIIPPFFGTGTVNRALIYGDYVPLYVSNPSAFTPYPISQLYNPPYKIFSNSAEGLINICEDGSHTDHDLVVDLWCPMARALLSMDNKKNQVRDDLESSSLNTALDVNHLGISSYTIEGENPSTVWKYDSVNSLQNLYDPNYLMQQDKRIIAPMNQWNSITYNPSEDYSEPLDVLLHPVPDMSFLDGIFETSGPLGELASALAAVASPYTFLPAIFMLGMDIYLQSQKEIAFLYATTTDYEISPCPESGMVMIKNNDQQMIYNISVGESGSIKNIPSGDFGTFFVDAVNSFSGGESSVSLINDLINDELDGGKVQYNNISSESQYYSLNLESHVGIAQSNLELCDTVICKIQGSGTMIMLPFKIGCWFQCEQGQTGTIKSKTTVGVRFKDDEKYYTYDLASCVLENINNVDEIAANQDGILMWSGIISINAEEYGKSEIEEIYLALSSSAKKTSGLNKVNCYTSLSFSPYFLKPIISLPQDIETFPGEEVTFQTELLEELANASINLSWDIPSGTESLEGYEVTYTFTESGIYDCKLVIDPEYQPTSPNANVTEDNELFWNSPAGKIEFPFQVKVLPPIDLIVDWELPPYVPLNTRNHPEMEFYPGLKAEFNMSITNEGVKDFHSNEYQDIPLKLSLFIDNNDNYYFEDDEKIWEEKIYDFPANSSKFYPVKLLFSLDKNVDDTTDETVVYWPNFYDCQLRVDILPEEENRANNSIRDSVEFISSPELDTVAPDFAVENASFSVDQYKNIEVHFDLAEKSVNRNIVDKWNSYHLDNPFMPQWGPIPYELWLRNNRCDLLYSGEVNSQSYQETKSIQMGSINLNYIPGGDYSLYLGLNPNMLIPETKWDNNHGYMNRFTLKDDTTSPWYTKGGDRGHTGWKNIDLKPPLITDWVVDTSGIPVDIVCNSDSFYVLTSSGSIEKHNASGELQYKVDGFDGTPLWSSVMLLIYPDDTEKERLLAFSDDCRLVLINIQTGDKIWTSNHRFTETTFGSKPNLNEYCRTLNFDGRYLIAGWPLVLYNFNSNMNIPFFLWKKEKCDAYNRGEAFIIGNNILAGQYLYNLNGEELEHFKWMDEEAILYLQNLYTDRNKYNFLSQQLTEMENLKHPGSLFSNKILCGNKMLCLDNQGNELWMLPNEIEQEYYADSSPKSIPVRIRPNSVINLWNGSQGYAYCINDKNQLLAVDLETGTPVWYREFVCLIADLREKIPPFMSSLLHTAHQGVPYGQSYLTMGEGFSVNIQKIIPFQNSLLVGTIDNKIYRLSSSQLHHFEVQGYIPSIFYGPSRLKVRVQAFNEQGAKIPLEDKITVTGDYIDQNSPRYYYVQEEISLPIGLPGSEMYLVDHPNLPYIVSNHFNFVDIQTLSSRVSVPLVIDNIQSRRRIRKDNTPAGEEIILSMDDEAQVRYKPKKDNNTVIFYYTNCDKEEISQVVHEHSYRIGVGIRNVSNISNDYDFMNLQINLPEGVDINHLNVEVNDKLYNLWSIENDNIIINCLDAFSELNVKYLTIILIKT